VTVHNESLHRKHDRSSFDCGEPALKDFIQRHARRNQEAGMNRTYVAVPAGELRVVGFYSLAGSSASARSLPAADRRRLPRHPVPLVQIARLAVDLTARGQGIGGDLLLDTLAPSVQAAPAFYRRYGFNPFDDHPHHLYLPLATVRALL